MRWTRREFRMPQSVMGAARIFAVAVLAQLSALGPALANDIARAEQWFNGLDTMEARFVQVASDGSNSEGTLYFRRPFRSRFEYDDPIPLVLITTESWLHVDEQDQRQVTSYPISETPLAAILSERVRLTSPDFLTSTERAEGVVRVILDQTAGEAAGRLVLEFTETPFELRRWLITDANGITTSVLLSNMVKGKPMAPTLFVPTSYSNDDQGQN